MIILKKNEKDMKNYLCAAALAMCLPVAVFSQPATDNPVSGNKVALSAHNRESRIAQGISRC